MMENNNENQAKLTDSFCRIFTSFGQALSEILNDPELKAKAKEFGASAAASASLFAGRFKDEEVKEKFEEVGKAAQEFGNGIARTSQEWSSKVSGKEKSDNQNISPEK